MKTEVSRLANARGAALRRLALHGAGIINRHYERGGPLSHTLAFEQDAALNLDLMEEAAFQKTVLAGIRATDEKVVKAQTSIDKVLSDYSRLDGETKKSFEELTKIKNTCNGLAGERADFLRKLETIQTQIRNQARYDFGDPIRRMQRNPEMRGAINASVRSILGFGDFDEMLKRDGVPEGLVTKAIGEDTTPGSTFIIGQLASEVYDTLALYGIFPTFRVIPVGTKTTTFPVKTARPVASWLTSEAATISDDATKAGTSINVSVLPLAVLLNVSLQLLQDSQFDVTADVMDDFAQAVAFSLDNSALNGDGTVNATYGGFTGAFVGGTAAVAAAGNVTVEGTDLVDWLRVLTSVDAIVIQRASRWWMHPQMLVRALAVRDQNGRPIFLTALESPSPGAIGSILGYPVTPAHAAPSANAASAKIALFGDPNGLVIPMRTDYQFDASDHFRWSTLQRSFRGYLRAAAAVRRATSLAYLQLPAA